ncbi:DUF6098 family protein [Streptomyces flaveolus]|uniref:DUF6098 family protein n=1 Tax=Streptomyces flaveolus TaxID=67297 RepID=UPI00332E0EDE
MRPWVLTGRERGRGPDNEPPAAGARPMCWIAPRVIEEARSEAEPRERPLGSAAPRRPLRARVTRSVGVPRRGA